MASYKKYKPGLIKTIQSLWIEPYNDLTAKELTALKYLVNDQLKRDLLKNINITNTEAKNLIKKLKDIRDIKYTNMQK
jgi:hypothetical protein